MLLKNYLKKEKTWELISIIEYFQRFIVSFYKNHLKELIPTLLLINKILSIVKLMIKPKFITKIKQN